VKHTDHRLPDGLGCHADEQMFTRVKGVTPLRGFRVLYGMHPMHPIRLRISAQQPTTLLRTHTSTMGNHLVALCNAHM
jgi:hypothetical protein